MIESTRTTDALHAKMSETRDNIVDTTHLAKAAVQEKLHELADTATQKYDAGKEKLHSLQESLAGKVQDSPMKSILIAAGVGLLLGVLVRRS